MRRITATAAAMAVGALGGGTAVGMVGNAVADPTLFIEREEAVTRCYEDLPPEVIRVADLRDYEACGQFRSYFRITLPDPRFPVPVNEQRFELNRDRFKVEASADLTARKRAGDIIAIIIGSGIGVALGALVYAAARRQYRAGLRGE